MDYLTPPITRVGQPVEEMAKLATRLLFECIESEKRISTQLELSPELISRESVKTETAEAVRRS
jgi:LacI family transcriptional regulator